jgi:hypothetical protein
LLDIVLVLATLNSHKLPERVGEEGTLRRGIVARPIV